MKKEEVMKILKENMNEIKKFGVKRIGIFGSVVRNEATENSDIDIYLEFDLEKLTFEKYLEFVEYLESLLGRKVDIITRDGVKSIRIPYIREEIERSIVYV